MEEKMEKGTIGERKGKAARSSHLALTI